MEAEDGCRIRVVCRVRPLNAKEQDTSDFVLKFPDSGNTIELGVRDIIILTNSHYFSPIVCICSIQKL